MKIICIFLIIILLKNKSSFFLYNTFGYLFILCEKTLGYVMVICQAPVSFLAAEQSFRRAVPMKLTQPSARRRLAKPNGSDAKSRYAD